MAYMDQDKKRELKPGIDLALAEHGLKGTLSVRHHSTLVLTIREGRLPLPAGIRNDHYSVNEYWYRDHLKDSPEWVAALDDLIPAMMRGNYNNSDPMSDYHSVGWYIEIKLGSWDKPYKVREV